MSRWFNSAIIAITSIVLVTPVTAADLDGFGASYKDTYAYDGAYDTDAVRTNVPRDHNRARYEHSRVYNTHGDDRRAYGPRYLRQDRVFQNLKYDLEDAGYSRIVYRTERRDHYGERIFYLTACANGVRYRLHVTADCEIDLKRQVGFCQSASY